MRSAALELHPDVAVHRLGEHVEILDGQTGPRERTSSSRTPGETDQPGQGQHRCGNHRESAQPTATDFSDGLHNGNQPTFRVQAIAVAFFVR